MSDPGIAIERAGAVATVWFSRPDTRNAFDEAMIAAVTRSLAELDADAGVRVVVIAGRGTAFCAGADLAWMRRMATFSAADNLADAARLAAMLQTLAGLSKPTVARVHGPALAGGTGIVAACDIAIATPDAVFGTTEVRLGLVPATISPYVIAAIGARAARRYFVTGERMSAAEAYRLGLVSELCDAAQLDERLSALIHELLQGAPGAQGLAKHLVTDFAGQPVTQSLVEESSRRIATVRGADEAREGIAAFFARRKPGWVA